METPLGNTMAMMLCSTGQVRPGSCARNSFQGSECLRLPGKGGAPRRNQRHGRCTRLHQGAQRPRARVREVGDEHPSRRVPNAGEEGHGEHEAPTLAQGASQRVGAQEPHAGPQAEDEGVVLDAARHPLAPEPRPAAGLEFRGTDRDHFV